MARIGVIGYFGYRNNQIDGQTIKTRQVLELLKRHCPDDKILFADTQVLQENKIEGMKQLLNVALSCKTIFYLPGENNLIQFYPILKNVWKLLGTRIIYPVVGGWLADFLKNRKSIRDGLRSFKGILVESPKLKEKLESLYGFKNVEVFPNFRITDYRPEIGFETPVKFVFMARVWPEKGCEYILDFAQRYNAEVGHKPYSITFFGQIAPEYEARFNKRVAETDNVEYAGAVNPDDVFSTLNKYDCLLLPTYYEGEGFPGSIIDSYIAGVPVLVTDWKDLACFVEEGKTGFVVPVQDGEALYEKMTEVLDNPVQLLAMKRNCAVESEKYKEGIAWEILKKYLQK